WALVGALDYFEEIGWDVIYERIAELSEYLMDGLKKLKIDVLTPKDARAGIVSFRHENGAKIEKQMAEKGSYFAYRDGFVRIAPHFYNTREDIDMMLKALKEMI
ncbi:MAG: aminotransferase class V-fold PLP-dependent enzyme, partial [Firmicutes bacterium]|nr:aminotransferase class V-fold PLP-dependent enzyme [Bacillota bacterium]